MSYLGTLGQAVIPSGFSVRWGPAGAPTDQELLGRGCVAGAVPQGEERRLVEDLIEVERSEQYAHARCDQQTDAQGRSRCHQGVGIGFQSQKAEKQAAIDTFCRSRVRRADIGGGRQPVVVSPEPAMLAPAAAPPRSNTLLYVAIGVGVLAVGYLLLK